MHNTDNTSKTVQRSNKHHSWRWWVLLVILLALTPAAMSRRARADSSIHLPALHNERCNGTRAASNPLGLQLYGPAGYDQPVFPLLQATQSAWARSHVDWFAVEQENVAVSQFRWGTADRALEVARDDCLNLIVTIDGTPRWAAMSHIHSPFTSDKLSDFVDFVAALVERYDGDGMDDAPNGVVVNYWEFYNEPDVGTTPAGDGWGVHAQNYADMLEAVYPVIKAANPQAQVVFGGISYDNFVENGGIFVRDFLDNVLEAGGGDYFDIMNVHFYPFHAHRLTWTKSDSSGLREKIADVQAKLAAHELSKPLMITEIGWHSNTSVNHPSTPEFQSRYVVQLLTQAVASGAVSIIWWSLVDTTTYPFQSGLATTSLATKPAYTVYLEAVQRLGEARDVHLVVEPTEENDLEVYASQQADTDKTQYIAWVNPIAPFNVQAVATFDDSVTQEWQFPGTKAEVFAKSGVFKQTLHDADDGATDGMITVTVGTSPIYIVVD